MAAKPLRTVSIIGARPQFIKASMLTAALRERGVEDILVHTGQHYDANMSKVFFDEMGIPKPKYNLGVGSGSHGTQTAAGLTGIEDILIKENPDWVIVYGDTNATLAGALAASKLNKSLAHVEAGLRSYNRSMPEEINRIVTDVLSDLLFCPTHEAVKNLRSEGISRGVHLTGDVMVDSLQHYTKIAQGSSTIINDLNLKPGAFYLLTIHRPSNADEVDRIAMIIDQLSQLQLPVIFPVHPRTKENLKSTWALTRDSNIKLIDPVGYLDMMQLESRAKLILTDSGGIQKEAYLHKVPCITLRSETEWVETVRDGWNILNFDNLSDLPEQIESFRIQENWTAHYGDGQAAGVMAALIVDQSTS